MHKNIKINLCIITITPKIKSPLDFWKNTDYIVGVKGK